MSYVVPAYNASRHIGELLQSVYSQTYRPIEVVIVDDGSSDNTDIVVRDFASTHNGGGLHIHIHRQENRGVSAARNEGIRLSRGSVLGYLDADDLIPPFRTTQLVQALIRNGADFVRGGIVRVYSDPELRAAVSAGESEAIDAEEQESRLPIVDLEPMPVLSLMSRALVERAGPWNEALSVHVDVEYTPRLLAAARHRVQITPCVYIYRIVQGSLCAGSSETLQKGRALHFATREIWRLHRERVLAEPKSRDALLWLTCEAARRLIRQGAPREAADAYALASEIAAGRPRLECQAMASLCRLPGFGAAWRRLDMTRRLPRWKAALRGAAKGRPGPCPPS